MGVVKVDDKLVSICRGAPNRKYLQYIDARKCFEELFAVLLRDLIVMVIFEGAGAACAVFDTEWTSYVRLPFPPLYSTRN